MNNNALIVLWNGKNLPDYLVQQIAEVLTTNGICIPEMLTIKYMDETSVSHALIRDVEVEPIVATQDESAQQAAIKSAVIYIGTRFKTALASKEFDNNIAFAIELYNAVADAKKRNISFVETERDDKLLTAVKIISEETGTIPAALARKYHFTQSVVNVIKKVYNTAF